MVVQVKLFVDTARTTVCEAKLLHEPGVDLQLSRYFNTVRRFGSFKPFSANACFAVLLRILRLRLSTVIIWIRFSRLGPYIKYGVRTPSFLLDKPVYCPHPDCLT